MNPIRPIVRTGILLAAAISAPASAVSTPISWTGATDTDWATGTNWTGGVAPADDLASNLAVFSLASYPNQPDALTRSIAGIVIGDGTTATAPVEIVGDALTIGASGIEMKANAGAGTLDTPIFLGAAQTWRNDSTSLLSTALVNGGTGTGDNGGFLLTTDGSGPIKLGRAITGAGGLVKNGSGTLTLAAAHTFTGPTTVNAGILEFGEGATGTLASAIANEATLKYNSSTDLILSGVVSGAGAFIKEGTGKLTLTAANTYSGTPTVNAGTLQLRRLTTYANVPGFTVNSGGTLDFDSNGGTWTAPAKPISLNGGTLSMTANGYQGRYTLVTGLVTVGSASTVRLNVASAAGAAPNASSFFMDGGIAGSAALTVEAGTVGKVGLVLRNSSSNYTGPITVNGLASVDPLAATGLALGLTAGSPNVTKANLTVNGTLEIGNQGMGWAGSITATGAAEAAINALGGTGVVTSNGAARTLSIGNDNGGAEFSGVLANGTAGSSVLSFTKNGSGTQTLSGDNSFTGTTTINGGTLRLNHQNALKLSILNTSGAGTLVFGSEVVGNAFSLGGLSGSGNLALANSDSAAIALTVGGANDSTYSGQLSGTGSLTKDGTGALTLGVTSNYSGPTTVNAGRLNLGGGLPSSDLTVGASGALGGEGTAKSITLNGGTLHVNATTPGTVTATNGLSVTAPVTIDLTSPPAAPGPIALLHYTGTFTGSLSNFLYPGGGTRSSAVTDTAGTIAIDLGSANRTWSGVDGIWELAGSSTNWVEGDQKFYNTDAVSFPDPTGPKAVTLNGTLQPSSITVNNSTGNTYTFNSGTLTGTGGITKNGTGTLNVNGTHAYTGTTAVNGGILTSSAASTASGSFLGGPGTATARRTVDIGTGAKVEYLNTVANGFLNLGAGTNAGRYGRFYDFNVSGTLAINDGAAVSQILQSTFNLSNGGVISNTGTAHTGAFGLLFGWDGSGGGTINVSGTGNQITADRIGFFNGATITTNAGAALTVTSIVKNGSTTASTLTKAGAGTLTLTATGSSYTGATAVNAGTLLINGTKTGTGAVTVANTATLGGTGSVAGATTIQSGGTLAPGDGAGNLTFVSTVDLQAGSTYAAEIASGGNDKVTATTFTANGTIKVTLTGGYSPATGTTFDLADATTLAGTPTFDFTAAVLAPGLSWDTTTYATDGTIKVTGTATGSAFDTWATANGVTGGKNGDDDNDGASNLLEFATAANPQNGASGARVYPLAHLIAGQKVLTYTVAVRGGATFASNGAKQQADKDAVRYVVEASNQLGTWDTVIVTELAPADATAVQAALGAKLNGLDAAWQWHSFRTDGDTASDPSDYIRLNVTDAP
jgi:fibronectin-binding autotransporter adhesin